LALKELFLEFGDTLPSEASAEFHERRRCLTRSGFALFGENVNEIRECYLVEVTARQEKARDFVFQKLADAGSSGVSILDLLAAASTARLSTRLLKHVLHDEEVAGSLRRDWNRRYIAVRTR
jgi:hypothetical protein